MDDIKCEHCLAKFNNNDHMPKILPCFALVCLKCLLKESSIINGEYLVNCKKCYQIHFITNIADLPNSQITLFINESNEENGKLENKTIENLEISSNKTKFGLKTFAQLYCQSIREGKYEVYKHYDHVLGDIDIRAEQLVTSIVKSSDKLWSQIKAHNDESNKFFNESDIVTDNENMSDILATKRRILSWNKESFSHSIDFNSVLLDSNKLQQHLNGLKQDLCYFKESSIRLDKYFLGSILNRSFDQNFRKITLLTQFLEESSKNSNKVNLSIDLTQSILKHEILPLEKVILRINFTNFRGLNFESFDSSSGQLINT